MSASPWLQEHVDPLLEAGRRVLLVEGEIDQKVYEAWLDRLAGGKGSGRVPNVVPSGGKSRVLQYLAALRSDAEGHRVFGLVDRDEWDDVEAKQRLADLPGLRTNTNRHCLESYFCDPFDLKPAVARSPIIDGDKATKAIQSAVKRGLSAWVGHWALWTTLERLKNSMSEAAYPDAFHQGIEPPDDSVVKTKLQEWAGMIDVDQVMQDYRALRKAALRRSEREQLHSCIYAKNVFPQVVLVELNKLRTEYESNEWMPLLAQWIPDVPHDVAAILQPMIL
jgi:hypothetical protein